MTIFDVLANRAWNRNPNSDPTVVSQGPKPERQRWRRRCRWSIGDCIIGRKQSASKKESSRQGTAIDGTGSRVRCEALYQSEERHAKRRIQTAGGGWRAGEWRRRDRFAGASAERRNEKGGWIERGDEEAMGGSDTVFCLHGVDDLLQFHPRRPGDGLRRGLGRVG